ncbi:MAG: MFS transporter [Victivallaceae bacterium]|nr:MFS transporter [Victivallaceae bacterium]
MFFTRRFFPFMTTLFFGAFNDNMFRNALVILITYQVAKDSGNAGALTFLAMGLLMLPYFPFSALAGEIADRFGRRRLFIITKTAELALMAATAAAFHFRNIPLLLVLIFLMGTQSAFFSPLKYSYIPQMLPPRELLKGNGYVNAGTYLAIIFGAVAGNLLIDLPDGTLFTGMALLLVAAAGLTGALAVPRMRPVNPGLKIHANCLKSTLMIVKEIFRDKTLRRCALGLSTFWMAGALYVSQLAPFCKEVLGADALLVMVFYLLFSAGVAIGSVTCSACGPTVLKYVPASLVLMAAFTLDLYFAAQNWQPGSELYGMAELIRIPGFWRVSADLLLLAVCGGFYSVPLNALLQKSSRPDEVARMVAGNNIINSAAIAVGTLTVSLAMACGILSVTGIFVVVGLINLGTGVYLYSLRHTKI